MTTKLLGLKPKDAGQGGIIIRQTRQRVQSIATGGRGRAMANFYDRHLYRRQSHMGPPEKTGISTSE